MSITSTCYDSNNQSSLQAAILMYGTNHRLSFASVHDVDVEKDVPRIKAGKPVTKASLIEMLQGLAPEMALEKVLLPSNVLSHGHNYLVWYIAPSQKNLWFACDEISVKDGLVPLPGLVFFALDKDWFVFAYKGDGRPGPDTELFNSPFLNVWEGGKICTGNVKLPESKRVGDIHKWEDAFFCSRFTHVNVRTKNGIVKYKEGPYPFWTALLKGKWRKFPQLYLVSTGHNLSRIFSSLVGGK